MRPVNNAVTQTFPRVMYLQCMWCARVLRVGGEVSGWKQESEVKVPGSCVVLQVAWCQWCVCGFRSQLLGDPQRPCHWRGDGTAHHKRQIQAEFSSI